MSVGKTDIWVYADWIGLSGPQLIGMLSVHQAKGRKAFSFSYSMDWLKSNYAIQIDPDIEQFSGHQFPIGKENFGFVLDSMPDTWGRTLMKRRAGILSKEFDEKPKNLYDLDFLLGVFDESRMGALRFKLHEDGPFLDDNNDYPTPPWSSIRELQFAVNEVESESSSKEIKKWLAIIMAPGSSLGGARPKANILDMDGSLWIAKFPSKNDTIDKAKWEYLAYKLAISVGIEMSDSKIEKVSGKFHTFFTKRFDREGRQRIHFASAMTMTGNTEDILKNKDASYLDIAEFIQFSSYNPGVDLNQLWLRIIFSMAISNTDDHLRNHGFILTKNGWRLSPAFDINPSVDKFGLALNVDETNSELDYNLAKGVGEYFQLSNTEMDRIIQNVKDKVSLWENVAKDIGISRSEREIMASAFRI